MLRAAAAAIEVRAAPSAEAELVDAMAPGDAFAVLEYAGGWAWGYVQATHVVGYVPAETLGDSA